MPAKAQMDRAPARGRQAASTRRLAGGDRVAQAPAATSTTSSVAAGWRQSNPPRTTSWAARRTKICATSSVSTNSVVVRRTRSKGDRFAAEASDAAGMRPISRKRFSQITVPGAPRLDLDH
ncbi:hypothetical protein AZA_74331 [Nitrospirillum viridazoti Y2]|nr:hypothetical protein AZA_74331 [Nitrospirillum amazonense Y2]